MKLFKRLYISNLLLLLMFLATVYQANSQTANPIAQLKFEDAEKAFNAGQLQKALDYIQQTEELAGVTSKTLYLKIITQDKMLATAVGEPGLKSTLKKNVQSYLKALEDQPIDDKYRTVYEISKRVDQYGTSAAYSLNNNSSGTVELPGSSSGQGISAHSFKITGPSATSASAILQAYYKIASGNVAPETVRTVKIEKENSVNGQASSKVLLQKAVNKILSITEIGKIKSKLVFNDGIAYIETGKRKISLPNTAGYASQVSSPEALVKSLLLIKAEGLDVAQAYAGVFEGQPVDILSKDNIQYLFNRNSHLLIGQEVLLTNGTRTVSQFLGYTNYSGLLMPATIVTQVYFQVANANSAGTVFSQVQSESSSKTEPAFGTEQQTAQNATSALMLIGARRNNKTNTQAATQLNGNALTGIVSKKNKKSMGLLSSSSALISALASTQPKEQSNQGFSKALQSAFGLAGNTTTTVTKIISVKINEPLDEKDFR
jgi:hypothetical protein